MTSTFDTNFVDATELLLEQYGESATLVPKSGPQRTITAIIEHHRGSDIDDDEVGEHRTDRLEVTCLKNADHASYPGISAINEGDALKLSTDQAGDGLWAWAGQIEDEGPAWWALVFQRMRKTRYGANERA